VPSEPVPVLPIRLWQEGVLLFAATAPSDPDHRLGLLEQGAGAGWQWLPLVGADFPVQRYAQRGPVIAWTPHLAGVAVKLDRKPAEEPMRSLRNRRVIRTLVEPALLTVLLLLTGANLWVTLSLNSRIATAKPGAAASDRALSQRTVGRVQESVRRALADKGYDPTLIAVACEHVHEQLSAEFEDKP
jgi:hypothetical protein